MVERMSYDIVCKRALLSLIPKPPPSSSSFTSHFFSSASLVVVVVVCVFRRGPRLRNCHRRLGRHRHRHRLSSSSGASVVASVSPFVTSLDIG